MKLKEFKRELNILFIIVILVCIDQLIKLIVIKNIYNSSIIIVNNFLNITYVENTGGAFGIGNNKIVIFIITNFIIVFLLIKYILSKKNELNIFLLFGFELIISGGIGNLIDRIYRGYVVDYIDINPLIKYPMFNFADICIVIGCILIIIGLIREKK